MSGFTTGNGSGFGRSGRAAPLWTLGKVRPDSPEGCDEDFTKALHQRGLAILVDPQVDGDHLREFVLKDAHARAASRALMGDPCICRHAVRDS